MPDQNTGPGGAGFEELDPLADLPEMEELEALPEMAELEPVSGAPAEAPLAALEEVPGDESGSGGKPESAAAKRRKQDSGRDPEESFKDALAAYESYKSKEGGKVPLHLKNAAVITAIGCMLPVLATGGSMAFSFGSKLVVLIGAYLLVTGVQALGGEKIDKSLEGMTKKRFVDAEKSPKGTIAMLQRMMAGTPLQLMGTFFVVGGIAMGWMIDPVIPNAAISPRFIAVAEVMMLAWAALTFVHITDYGHSGGFSPMFPLVFLGHAIAGPLALFGQLAAPEKNILALVGALPLTAGGLFAVWTMYEAFQAAGKETELKKRVQMEHRKLERARKQGG